MSTRPGRLTPRTCEKPPVAVANVRSTATPEECSHDWRYACILAFTSRDAITANLRSGGFLPDHLGDLDGDKGTLIPPTGTVNLMLDCETTGIEPYYALAGRKRFADGEEVRFDSRALADGLPALGYSTHAVEQLSWHAADHGHLAGAPGLRPADGTVVQTASGPDQSRSPVTSGCSQR